MLLFLTGAAHAKPSIHRPAIMDPTSISLPDEDNKSYSEVVECGNVTQADLFRRARLYLAQTALDNKTIVTDKETGDLASQGSFSLTVPRSEGSSGGVYSVRYVLTIECVNRKYRATITGELAPLKAFSSKSAKESEPFNAALEAKFKALLQELQANVKDYKPF